MRLSKEAPKSRRSLIWAAKTALSDASNAVAEADAIDLEVLSMAKTVVKLHQTQDARLDQAILDLKASLIEAGELK
jgi:hypothetical protein